MTKMIKILLIILFIVTGLFSGFFSFAIIGAGVSGSGCGSECLESSSTLKTISIIAFLLAIVFAAFPSKKVSVDKKHHD